MGRPCFFGYGSLVNIATHDYPDPQPALLRGWRRAWVETNVRDLAFLSCTPSDGTDVQGLIATVPDGNWTALDDREFAYRRLSANSSVAHNSDFELDVHVYSVVAGAQAANLPPNPVWLSYLDVVIQGYLNQFGTEGVEAFFATTDVGRVRLSTTGAHPNIPGTRF